MPHGKILWTRFMAMLALCLALSLAAGAVHADTPRTARIGFAARLSDPLAQSAQHGAELAIDEANAQSARTRDGWRFELLSQDDRSNANFATNVANYFIKASVAGVIGPWSSDSTLATLPLYAKANIPQLNFTSSNSKITAQGHTHIFRVVGGSDDVAAILADVALQTLEAKRIVVIGNASSYSRALSEQFSAQVVKRAGRVAPADIVSRNTADFNAALKKATAQNADLILFSAQFTQARDFLETAKRMGIDTNILMAGGATNVDFTREDNGKLYVLEYDVPQENCARWKTFEQRFRARFKTPPSTYARYTFDATSMLVQAIRQADGTDGDKLKAILHKMRYAGLGGEIAFDEAGNLLKPTYTLYHHAPQMQWRVVRYFPADARPPARCPA